MTLTMPPAMTPARHTVQLLAVLGLLVLIKMAGLVLYGPVHMPDSADYVAFAHTILNTTAWLSEEDLTRGGQPATSFRMIGYPAFIALTKLLAGDAWDWLAVLLQFALSLVASGYVYFLSTTLMAARGGGHRVTQFVAVSVTLVHGVGQSLVLDQCILTDSLNASFLLILAAHTGIAIVRRRAPGLPEVLALGTLILGAFLLREAAVYLQILYWPFVVCWAVMSGASKGRVVCVMIAFALPMIAGAEAYKSWNQFRTGERYITTSTQNVAYFPGMELDRRGIAVFAGDALLHDMEALDHSAGVTRGQNVARIRNHLMGEHGFSHLDLARYGMDMFFDQWRTYPAHMISIALREVQEKQAFIPFMPAKAAIQLKFWATGDNSRDSRTLYVLDRMERIVAVMISLAFLIGVPVLAVRQVRTHGKNIRNYDPAATTMVLYWLLYAGFTSVYALVHLELRYLMPVEPLTLVIGVVLLVGLGGRVRAH